MDAAVAQKSRGGRAEETVAASATASAPSIAETVARSCRAMTRYAFGAGIPVPSRIVELVDATTRPGPQPPVSDLVRAHDHLARLVHPALPQTLVLLERERRRSGLLTMLGPVRLVRHLMLASGFFLFTFIATSLSPYVNESSGDLFNSSGLELLVNEAFFLSAAGVGASFAALFQVNRYIAKGTYDPKFDASYWTRFILGLIAGIVLAELIPVEGSFTRPALALIGGFSASVVYRILTRIVETLESFVSGELPPGARPDSLLAGGAEVAGAGVAIAAAERVKLAQALTTLRNEAVATGETALNEKLAEIVTGLVGDEPSLAAAPQDAAAPPGASS